jgi:hypothetical protein
MSIMVWIGLIISISFLLICFYAIVCTIIEFRIDMHGFAGDDPKNQTNRPHSFGYMGAFGGDAGAACGDGGGGGSCS